MMALASMMRERDDASVMKRERIEGDELEELARRSGVCPKDMCGALFVPRCSPDMAS